MQHSLKKLCATTESNSSNPLGSDPLGLVTRWGLTPLGYFWVTFELFVSVRRGEA